MRALRRHHAQRRKRRVRRLLERRGELVTERVVGIVAKTPKPCSCWACGHRREHEGATVQERREAP